MTLTQTPSQADRARFALWRDAAADKMPYLAPILFRFVPVRTTSIDSFAVDSRLRCYVNFDAVADWPQEQLAFALLHECGHVWQEHDARARAIGLSDNDAQAQRDFNAGGDAAINDDLESLGFDCTNFITPSTLGEPEHLTAEHYYGVIRAKRAARQSQQGQGQPQQGQSGDGNSQPFRGCGSASGGQSAPCELPDDGGELGEGYGGSSGADIDAALDAVAHEISDAVRKGRGDIPGSMVEEMQQRLAPPKVPWQQVLRSAVRRNLAVAGRGHRTPTRCNRRRHNATLGGRKLILPGQVKPTLDVVFVRDTSGSMSVAELNAIGNEVEGVSKAAGIKGNRLQVIDVDSVAYDPRPYRGLDTLNAVQGRGGTDMGAGLVRAAQMKPLPSLVIVGTDGGTYWPSEAPPFPVIIAITGTQADGGMPTPEWAQVVYVDF